MKSFSNLVYGNELKISVVAIVGILAFFALAKPVLSCDSVSSKIDLTIPIPSQTAAVGTVNNPEYNTTFVKLVVPESLVAGTAKLIVGSD